MKLQEKIRGKREAVPELFLEMEATGQQAVLS
jgi:hypothetical protein